MPHRKAPQLDGTYTHWAFRKPPPLPPLKQSVDENRDMIAEALLRIAEKERLRKEEEERIKRESKRKGKGRGGGKKKKVRRPPA